MTCLQLLSSPLAMLWIFHPLGQALGIHWQGQLIGHSASFSVSSGWHPLQTAWPGAREAGPKGPCHVYCTAQASARHNMGGPATQPPSVSVKKRQYYGNAAPVWFKFFTQHITSQSFYPAHTLYGYPSVEVSSCSYTWQLMKHVGKKEKCFWKIR